MTRLLCLGDSYTIGEGVAAEHAWPHTVGRTVDASVEVIAETGWTVDDLLVAITEAEPGEADIVTVLIGVNDQYDGVPFGAVESGFEAVLDRAVGLAGACPGRVVCITIPDWSSTPFAETRDPPSISREVAAYNQAIIATAARRGHVIADLAPLREAFGHLVVDDGLHPAIAVHEAWAAGPIGTAIKSVLRSTDI